MLEAAVGGIPRLSLLDVDDSSAFVARKTRWFGQPARMKFEFTAESASSTIIEADFRESLFGPDLGAASADLLEIFEGLAREVKAAVE